MKVIPYDSKYKDKFIEYNTDWIVDNFDFLEKEDKETFENIEEDIKNGAMQWAVGHGAPRLFILSNSKLSAALHIYEKFGFKEIKLDNYEYIRGDIAFEKIIG